VIDKMVIKYARAKLSFVWDWMKLKSGKKREKLKL